MAQISSRRSQPDSERIANPVRVARLLERVARQHALLSVEIPGHPERYVSCIVGVDGTHVLLDELVPAEGHALLLAERRLRVTGKLDGIDIRFRTTLDFVDDRDGMVTYHAMLPGQLDYRQRRQDYRAHIPMSRRLRVVITQADGAVSEGLLHDLSHGGAGFDFPAGTATGQAGRAVACALELPEAGWLYCTVELRYARAARQQERQLVGARFLDLSPLQVRLVTRCIVALERELIRKRTAY